MMKWPPGTDPRAIHPMSLSRTCALRDQRMLEVHEYGDAAGHPVLFFHGLIGSHHQASYIHDQAARRGVRIIAPNRPGVGGSGFAKRASPLEAVADVEDLVAALALADFSVIGISGGTPYALATLLRFRGRVRTTTVVSGMGPMRLPSALAGMDPRRRLFLEAGARQPYLAKQAFQKAAEHFQADPERFLNRLVATWARPDRTLFRRRDIFELFLLDLHQVFTESDGHAAEGLARELAIYRNYGFSLSDLPVDQRVVLWHGLDDTIVPPAMCWKMARAIPNSEAHLFPGGHFMALDAADQIIQRIGQLLDNST